MAGRAAARPPSVTETIAATPAAARWRGSTSSARRRRRGRSGPRPPDDRQRRHRRPRQDGLADIVAADATTNRVTWARQGPPGRFTERTLADVPGPVGLAGIDASTTALAGDDVTSPGRWPT